MKKVVKDSPSGYSIKILRSVAEIEKIRSFWEAQQWHPDGDIDLVINVIISRKEVVSPYILLILNNNKPETIIIGIIETRRILYTDVSYHHLYSPELQVLTFIPGRVLGNENNLCSSLIITQLQKSFKLKEFDLIVLNYINSDSPFFRLAQSMPGFISQDDNPNIKSHWKLILPGSIDDVYNKMDTKQRHELFRKERRIQNECQGTITYRCYKDETDLPFVLNEIETIAQKTRQRFLERDFSFRNNTEMKFFLSISANHGWLRSYLLYIDDKPCAFYIGIIYKNIFYFYFSGIDMNYNNCSPGVVLLKHILEEIYNCDDDIKEIDWGTGDTLFKKHLGNYSEQVGILYIFPPTLYGLYLNCTKALLVFTITFLKTVLIKLGIKDKITSPWRHYFIKRQLKKY